MVARMISNSYQTAKGFAISAFNAVWFADHASDGSFQEDQRGWVRQYALGAPGVAAGIAIGALIVATTGLSRMVIESWNNMIKLFVLSINLALPNSYQFELVDKRPRTWVDIYLLGAPGAIPGILVGLASAMLIATGRMINQSALSWASLSGSLINGSLKQPVFAGLGGDDRTWKQKLAGSPGYLLAMLTTFPLSLVILTGKFIAPMVAFLAIGVVVSPLIASLKWLKMALNRPRFDNHAEQDERIEKFQNIYSALDATGNLPANKVIAENQDGKKGPACFVRKAITFNVSSVTEQTLDGLLAAWNAATEEQKETFFDDNSLFDKAVNEAISYYSKTSALEFRSTTLKREAKIREVADFVKSYITEGTARVPEKVHSKVSWAATFWGGVKQQQQVQEDRDLDTAPNAEVFG